MDEQGRSAVAQRRHALPLGLLAVLVVVGIYAIFVLSGLIGGVVGAVVAVTLIVWLQRRADTYVRARASSEDD